MPNMLQNLIHQLPNNQKKWFTDLTHLLNETISVYSNLTEELALFKYAENKWSLKQLLDHLTECEKIFNYRALRFTKNDGISLSEFDENLYVEKAHANLQPLAILLEEFKITRLSSIYFYGKLSTNDLKIIGKVNNHSYTVEHIIKHMIQHNQHHLNIIKERYLPQLI